MKNILQIFLLIIIPSAILAQNGEYEKREFIRGTDTLRYRILLPKNYKPKKKYPVVLFLHGSGERGSDNQAQLTHGGKLFSDPANMDKYPAFVIFPQCPAGNSWARGKGGPGRDGIREFATDEPMTKPLLMVSQLMDSLSGTKSVDKKRLYIGGLSMGGFGTFDMLARKPIVFAAAFPICGGGDSTAAERYGKNFPIWVFHGGADPVVTPANSRRMVTALKSAGANVKYSEYPGVGHDSWTNAFAEAELLPWLFSKKK
ncbi:MAG TPA: prolyl oligopeptidase family serine peptidase [Chitinophagaceae bacterium]|nr:prolyl oligopeptidase family serine peptidase [Chitinophagaceae bacterium]